MIRVVEFGLRTVSEANSRFASKGGMFKRAERIAEQRATTRAVLNTTFGAPPPLSLTEGGWTAPNPIVITLTRIAPGIGLDEDENLPMAFKAVKDEIAAWFGLNDRTRALKWSYAQERADAGVYKTRIEITDASPGADIRVVLASEVQRDPTRPLVQRKKRKAAQLQIQGTNGARPCFAALPWEQPPCAACDGEGWLASPSPSQGVPPCPKCIAGRLLRKLVPIPRFVGLASPPLAIEWRVPRSELRRYTSGVVQLHRVEFTTPKLGTCWLYREHTAQERAR